MPNEKQTLDSAPDAAMVRANQICGWLGIGRATLWRWQKDGHIVPPVRLSGRVTAWRVGDVRKWLDAKAQG
jgi:prophage regulatory protein